MEEADLEPRWDQAIELLLAGASHRVVAERVGCHRNTVRNMLKDPAFRLELSRRADERQAEVKLRRVQLATRSLDRLSVLAQRVLTTAEQFPLDLDAQRAARGWLAMYQKMLKHERLDLG